MPSHKWRLRPPHPCQNPECQQPHTKPGRFCPKCQKRLNRHKTFEVIKAPPHLCSTSSCRSRVKAFNRCTRCHGLWKKGVDPETYHRPYRRLCSVEWCPEYSHIAGMCMIHLRRIRCHGDVRRTRNGIIEPIPVLCTHDDCSEKIWKRGLCLRHLMEKSRTVILLREFWPNLPGHETRNCIGKPNCKRNAILFGRCPDCLYDWQGSLHPRRNFFKMSV